MRSRSVVVIAAVAVAASVTGSLTASAAGQRGTSGTSRAALQGATGSPSGSTFTPITPCRIVDTRHAVGGAVAGGSTRTFVVENGGSLAVQGGSASGCDVPSNITAIQANVVSVDATGSGYLTVFPAGGTAPLASFLNFRDGKAIANGGTVTVSSDSPSAFAVKASRTTDVVVDVSGYYSPPLYAFESGGGQLSAQSGVLLVSSPSTGRYDITFDRNLVGCSFAATSTDPSIVVGAQPSIASPDVVEVSMLDTNQAPVNREFYLTVTC
jgi:hypothetical protein